MRRREVRKGLPRKVVMSMVTTRLYLLVAAFGLPSSAAGAPPPRTKSAPITRAPPAGVPSGPATRFEKLSLRELEIERALPIARRGGVFRTPWLDDYFRKQPWYRATGFDERLLSAEERRKIDAVSSYLAKLSTTELF